MRKAIAVDLDGTLFSTNTFQDYLLFCGREAMLRFRFLLALQILVWVTLRKLRLVRHSRMKRALLNASASFMQRRGRLDNFVEQELLHVNHQAQLLMEQYRNRGNLLILVTAAPDLYARPIAETLHFDLCCATPLPSEVVIGQWQEYVGENKVQALQRLLQVHKAELDVVITDHYDDIPLLRYNSSGQNFLIHPTEATLSALRKEPTIKWDRV